MFRREPWLKRNEFFVMKTQIQFKVLVFLISVIFLYCGGWFISSQWMKTEIETFLTDTLAKNEQIKIHYEALEHGGFPFSLDWHLVNPKMEVNVLLHSCQQTIPSQSPNAPPILMSAMALFAFDMFHLIN